jgi:hypothetical protein
VSRVYDPRKPVRERPLGTTGERLLFDLYRRLIFRRAIEDGVPIGRAGEELLGLKRSAASKLNAELAQDGNLFTWFRREALRLMQSGKIPRGRATIQSGNADAFHKSLAGGPRAWGELKARFGNASVIDAAAEAHKEGDLAMKEALDYLMNTWLSHETTGETLCGTG